MGEYRHGIEKREIIRFGVSFAGLTLHVSFRSFRHQLSCLSNWDNGSYLMRIKDILGCIICAKVEFHGLTP